MPPRTRATKLLKENIGVVKKTKQKSEVKVKKPPRKALADKTNSVSDDNASIDIPIKTSKKVLKCVAAESKERDNVRPRRERKLPPRYVENHILKNLSNSKDSPVKQHHINSKTDTPTKQSEKLLPIEAVPKDTKNLPKAVTPSIQITSNPILPGNVLANTQKLCKSSKLTKKAESTNKIISKASTRPRRNCRLQSAIEKPVSKNNSSKVFSPLKTPPRDLENSLVGNRPKRICRLPSRFEDHSISPNKFIPVQPCHASTPITKNTQNDKVAKGINGNTRNLDKDEPTEKSISKHTQKPRFRTDAKACSNQSSMDKSSPDSNNNGRNKIVRTNRQNLKIKLQTMQENEEANKIKPFGKRLLDKSLSFKILEDRKQSNEKGNNLDVYEFTFDPNEEPPPQKKKRKKRTVKKEPSKPKMVMLKSNYNDVISKALKSLKSKIKPSQDQPVENNIKPSENIANPNNIAVENVQSTPAISKPITKDIIRQSNNYSSNVGPVLPINVSAVTSIHDSNYASIHIEDIAAGFEPSDHHDDINYSPVTSPIHPPTPEAPVMNESQNSSVLNKDPLNLLEDLSIFDEQPVASSSMNVSVRHPLASPWRVEFGNLPMKWHSDTYVKPNMTPAVECSFINSEEMSKKKHVYTNMVPEEPMPEIVENNPPNLKQPSIISFMREVAEKSANKKKRRRSPSPTKANSIFDDITATPIQYGYKTPKKAKKSAEKSNVSSDSNNRSDEKENSNQNKSLSPDEHLVKDKDCTYFGFDNSENIDQENISPVKIISNTRTRGLRSRTVLQQLNAQVPARVAMPGSAKPKLPSSEVVEQLYDQMKSAEDASQFPEKETAKEPEDNTVTTNVDDPSWHENDDDSQSVHLFEDIEVIHHLKPHRKSYGKAKKVTFPKPADSDSDSQQADQGVIAEPDQSSDDDLADLTFQMPDIKPKKTMKKKKPKKQLTKKEEKEVEEWAAGFNSMCEDIDEFPLVVE